MKELLKNFFSGYKPQVLEKTESKKGYPEIVLKIHKKFNTASQRLLDEANEILAKYSGVDTSKGERLSRFGFNSNSEAQKHFKAEDEKRKAKLNAQLVHDYSIKYFHKFITEDQVKTICEKYGLLCGKVSLFEGFVPDKNLKEIENFRVKEEDIVIDFITEHHYVGYTDSYMLKRITDKSNEVSLREKLYKERRLEVYMKRCLKICAPQKDFNLKDKKIIGYNIVDKDPIVLAPVKGGYLIVTAWGDEASDPIVVNSKMN